MRSGDRVGFDSVGQISVAHFRGLKTHCVHAFKDTEMKPKFDLTALAQFTGTERYYRMNRKCLLTDGTKYLADSAEAYWLLDAAASYLMELGTADWFVLVRLSVKKSRAELTLEDGNGGIRARQQIPYTDFPADQQVLYACWDGEHWVIMLPSEY
jgi:hypothetical protein